jgi:glycosyltransferase involved in cell wall biosynthesis
MSPGLKVSVSIVTYNHRDYLGPCLESVLTQDAPFAFEIVVGDDASNDGTGHVLRRYAERHPGRIRAIHQPVNVGAAANWQAVLDACRGEYIAHLDGDDLMRPGKLRRQATLLDARPEVSQCFHNMRVFESETGRSLGPFTLPGGPVVRTLDDLVRHGTVYCHGAKMYRRSALAGPGLDRRTRSVMDWLVHLENARHGEVAYIDEILGEYRRHRGATTARSVTRHPELLEDQLYTLTRAREFGASPAALAAGESRVWYLAALAYLDEGESVAFRRAIEQSVAGGVVLHRNQRLCYRLRHTPALLRVLTCGYRELVMAPRAALYRRRMERRLAS